VVGSRARRTLLWTGTLLALVAPLAVTPVAQAGTTPEEEFAVVNTEPPSIVGTPAYGEVVVADRGSWEPSGLTYDYQWLVDGEPVAVATSKRYRPQLDDIGHRIRVEVTATGTDPETGEEHQTTAASENVRVVRGTFGSDQRPTIGGEPRYDHTLVLRKGSWTRRPDVVRVQWLRNGRPIAGATGRRHHLGLADFDERISVRLTARKEGYRKAAVDSRSTDRVMHRVPVSHTVTYRVETRGKISADLDTFKQQAQQTYDDPRGWRGSGIAFRRVSSGGSFVLVLSEASQVPTFSSGCSAEWSCRVGDYVIINQMRWLHASPMWHQQKESTRDYRHMVVNHETGHWLGHGHRYCPSSGSLAPVMQQQSKGLAGCRPNPWPTVAERRVPRFG
jgi:Protein of unknown function (DUF3152)